MVELFAAIQLKYDGHPIHERAPLWMYDAPEGSALPVVTCQLLSAVPDATFDAAFEGPVISFSIWSGADSPIEVTELRDTLTAIFDGANLNVVGYATVHCKRINEHLNAEPGMGFGYHIDYQLLLQAS